MNKTDINTMMLFKLKTDGLCILLSNDNELRFYNKSCIVDNCYSAGISRLTKYKMDLSHCSLSEFNIVNIKQCNNLKEVLYYIINDVEPEEWDWVREEKKEIKLVKLPVCIKNNIINRM
jgi:hypothetical protein